MTTYKIRSKLKVRIEGVDRARIEARLAEVRKQDPAAKIIAVRPR